MSAKRPTGIKPLEANDPPVVWVHPRDWKTDNRTRRYITLLERGYSHEGDFDMLVRSMHLMLKRQDARGSFFSDDDYRQGDHGDDQIGVTCLLAYYLFRTGPDLTISEALEWAVRFHLDHLVFRSPGRLGAFSRGELARDTPGDWCNTLWCIGSGALTLRYGAAFLTPCTVADLRGMLVEYWRFLASFPTRDENPCHNQLLAFCEGGARASLAVGDKTIMGEVLAYYHGRLRRLRVRDRGYMIYTEFNQLDIHYGALSWHLLEELAVMSGDPAVREDADTMTLAFHEQVSAGGYYWGGPRNNECGVDEFPELFTARDAEFGFSGLLFPEPSHLWRQMTVGGHNSGGLVSRMEAALPSRQEKRVLPPTPWHFQRGNASLCLQDDTKMHHVSAAGLEIISVPNGGRVAPGLRWLKKGVVKEDRLQVHPPKASEGLRFCDSRPIELENLVGMTSMQRGYYWETRQWWFTSGATLVWIGQLITHFSPECDQVHFVLGNPVLTRVAGRPVPVAEVESAEGVRADTQGAEVTVGSTRFLRFGDVLVGATVPLEFVRPSSDAFHTFPLAAGCFWRDYDRSNELRVVVDQTSRRLDCRESLFFAVEIGKEVPRLETSATGPNAWTVKTTVGSFVSQQDNDGIWKYTLQDTTGSKELPYLGFGYRD